ncbi:hypothetical protein U8527_21845 [Kordia algicida OT-1]|nr:hypothetical protein [Kordia algicida]
MKKSYLFSLMFLSAILVVHSQNYDYVNTDRGTSYDDDSSGGKNIRIPLHTVRIDGTKIPIYLSYNSKGKKVSEMPTSVGFNWRLNAGGEIRKKINHLVDESENGWLHNSNLSDYQENIVVGQSSTMKDLLKKIDAAPDIFMMSLSNGDYTNFIYEHKETTIGTFLEPVLINQSKNINKIYTNLELLSQYRYPVNSDFEYANDLEADITFTGRNGVNYKFRKGIKRERAWDLRRRTDSYIDSADYKNYYLHKIVTDINNEEIDFEYDETKLYKFMPHAKATRRQTNSNPQTVPSSSDPIVTEGYYYDVSVEDVSRKDIRRIITQNEIVEFTYKDHDYVTNLQVPINERPSTPIYNKLQQQIVQLLDEIKIYDYQGNYVFGYKFEYTEQTGNQNTFEGIFKLKKILKYGRNHKDYIVYRKFDYYSDGSTSSPISNAQDVFGYPNSAFSNNESNFTPIYIFQGIADRMPDEAALTRGMLKTITNITGGKTEYKYKENTYNNIYYGGLLIKEILTYDNVNSLAKHVKYEYDNPEGFGLPVYDTSQYNQGVTPPNGYSQGYYEGYQQAWQTYFTKQDPIIDHYQYPYLTSYNVSSMPYDLLKETPLLDQLILNLGFQTFTQIDSGSFYSKVTQTNHNVTNGLAEKGSTVHNFIPSISGFNLSKKMSKTTQYDSQGKKVKEVLYNYDTVNFGIIDAFEFDNVHLQANHINPSLYRYVVKSYPIYKTLDVLKSVVKKDYVEDGNELSYETTFIYLNELDGSLNTTDYTRVKEMITSANGDEFEKTNFKYLSEYDNLPDDFQGLHLKNPQVEQNKWVKSGTVWKLEKSQVFNYLLDGKVKKIGEVLGNQNTGTYYTEATFISSSFDASSNFISLAEYITEYEYSTEGKLMIEKDLKSQTHTLYQRSNEYGGLRVDAILETRSLSNTFLKKSFENLSETGVVKFNKAFSGKYVYNGNTLLLGNFPAGYEVSFWTYKGNHWSFNSYLHTGGMLTIEKPIGVLCIDEVIVKPKNSTVATRTYSNQGITSSLDETGNGTRVEFDLFARKLYDLDKQHNILKEYRYNTKNLNTTN